MGLLEQLQEQGWHLLPAGIERLLEGTPGTNLDVKQAIKLALDIDLREIGGGALSSISARGTKADSIDGNIVVQVLKVRNISAPKANEESKAAPRLLKLTLTDGQTQYSALEGEHVSSLSLDTAPGTKMYLKNGPIKISQGLLILNANNVSILGGKVAAMVEKWELGRAMAKYAKGGRMQLSASGPPPWIPFGQKIQQNVPADKNFKSLQTKEKDESKENAEFTALRNDAIAEANKLGTKKTFGGGAKQMVDANVQKIMDKGFSEDQANHALKLTRNNVHRALSNLQRIEERKQQNQPGGGGGSDDFKSGKVEPPQKLGGKPSFRGKRDSESDASSKPSAKVSLFDFLEDILPETDASANKKSSSKESTPFGGKDGKPGVDSYASKQSGGYNSYSSSNPNNRSSNSASSGGNPYQSNTSSSYNSASKSYNQQRFENNISSSFANRNTHPGSNNRSYGQQNSQQQQQNSNPSGGYKQQSYDYNNTRGYRGGPPNATGGSGGGYHNSEGHPRGGRPESKYNQSHSSYNNPHQQSQQQYRNDSYNNNNGSSNTGTGPQGNSKYAPNSGSGKSQATSNSSYQGGGYGGHTDSRGAQNYNGQADSTGGRKHPGYQQHQTQQQQQQQQQSSYQGSKPVQGYNATGGAGSVGNHTGGHQSNVANNNHYGQHNAGGVNNNYSNSNSTQGPKPAKGSRYTKEDSQKFSGPPPKSTTTPPSQNQSRNSGPGQQPPQKVHNNPSQQQQHGITPSAGGMQPPFINKQPSPGPPGSSNNNLNNNATKMAQLTEATAGMQIGSKQFNSNSQHVMAGKPHQQQGPMVSGPPPHPAPATTPVVPKNYIQLPNGFNPYQIMGFQNKQTNEFALNVLKSQQFDALQSAHLAAGQLGGPPVTGPIPGVPVVSSVLAPAGPGMPAGAGGVLPNWKIGDRCLAKYWEDGGFYNAEITAISESTFVVCFLEYGNYEEVLKTDCIPLTGAPAGPPPPATMGFHHPQAALGVQPHPAMMAPHPPPPTGAYPVQGAADSQSAAQQHFNPGGYKPQPSQYPPHPHHGHPQQQQPPPHHQQRPSKFREQRPMYVPPAQRK